MDYDELIAMADMYASTCTGQEEKYQHWLGVGYTWRWADCIAAFELIRGLSNWWELVERWQKANKCQSCGHPNPHHSCACRLRGDY